MNVPCAERRIQSAVENFREAAIFSERWPQALDSVAECLNSDGATLLMPPSRAPLIAFSASIETRFQSKYFSLPFPDPREQRVNPRLQEGFKSDHAYFSSQEIARDPYYQEFLVPCGFGWHAVATLGSGLVISLKRGGKRGSYGETELAALNTALPWLRGASRVASTIWRSNLSGQLRLLERIDRGAILIDARGRVLDMNACVELGDGLDISGGSLQATRPADRMRLNRFLAAAIDSSRPPAAGSSALVLARPSGLRAWLLDAIACTDAVRSLHSRAAALVLITDVERDSRLNQCLLRDMFGLTTTETRLAGEIISGKSLREAAGRISISEAHARQRLKVIFRKTSTHRQGELVALLAKLRSPAEAYSIGRRGTVPTY